MDWYVRTLGRTEGVRYAALDDAIAQVQTTVNRVHADKRSSRTDDGKIQLHYPDGTLFEVIWIEDENGRVMRF